MTMVKSVRIRRPQRPIAGLGVVIAFVLAAAGCGQSASEDVAVVRRLDLMQAAESSGSARVAITAELPERDGTRATSNYEGVIDLASLTGEMVGSFSVESEWPEGAVDEPLAQNWHFESRSIEAAFYNRFWMDGDEAGPWIKLPATGGEGWASEQAAQIDPHAFLEKVREVASEVTEVGSDDIRGTAATRYEVTVDPADFGRGAARWGITGLDPVTISAWVDDDDLLRKVEAGPVIVELWDYGVPVEVEVPTDLADAAGDGAHLEALSGVLPELTGEWAEQAAGSTAGKGWTLFAAEARVGDTPTTCRSLHVDGEEEDEQMTDLLDRTPFVIHHEGSLATCGSGFMAVRPGATIPDPSVQVVSPSLGGGGSLTALIVAPRWVDSSASLATDNGPIALDLDDSGVVVLDRETADSVTAVVLDDGAVTCPVEPILAGAFDGETLPVPDSMIPKGLALGLGPCVRS